MWTQHQELRRELSRHEEVEATRALRALLEDSIHLCASMEVYSWQNPPRNGGFFAGKIIYKWRFMKKT
jgi:hypothetical protein